MGDVMKKEAYKLVRQLGITGRYKGYKYLCEAILLAISLDNDEFYVTKDIYPVIARKYKVKPESVEHDIRTVIKVMWEQYRSQLNSVVGFELPDKPTNLDLIDMLSFYIRESKGEFDNE